MKTNQNLINNNLSIIIEGHITGRLEVMQIKDIFDNNQNAKMIELVINDAYVIPSILIGILVREIEVNNRKVRLVCSQEELKTLIKDLNLDSMIEIA